MAAVGEHAAAIVAILVGLSMASSAQPVITHLTHPTFPNETVLVSGGPFFSDCTVRLATTSAVPSLAQNLSPIPGQVSSFGLAFTIPASFPVDVYSVSVGDCNGGQPFSKPSLLNAPQPWWVQGDLGDTASPGGWVRVHGLALQLDGSSSAERASRTRLRAARDALTAAQMSVDLGLDDDSPLYRATQEYLAARAAVLAHTQPRSIVLRLTATDGSGDVIDLKPTINFTAYGGAFLLPSDVRPAHYNVSFSNGYGVSADGSGPLFAALDTFVDGQHAHESGIEVRAAAPWPAGVFMVDTPSVPCVLREPNCTTSDESLQHALQQAHAAGGGTVYFPRGKYYLSTPILVPPHTKLVGERTDLVSIYFIEYTKSNAPFSLIQLDESALSHDPSTSAAWGITDLTIYVTAFHNSVMWVSNRTNGFFLKRVRARVNAYFALDDIGTLTRQRISNWTELQTGHLVDLHARNFEITDCDLFSTAHIINSQAFSCPSSHPFQCAGAYYGYVARNMFWNGAGGSHFMCMWQQVVIEQNVAYGASLFSHGQALDTGIGGVAQHVFNADNVIKNVWGGDREVMTYDTESGSYYGKLASIEGTTVTTAHDCLPVGYMKFNAWNGGALAVLNGTGAGQVRRVVVPGINDKPTPTNRTWVIDREFDIVPEPTAVVQIMAFRGRSIFFRNKYSDVGPFQLYTISLESVAAEIWAERFEGFVGFGQWRGWNNSRPEGAPNSLPSSLPSSLLGSSGAVEPAAREASLRLGGEMGIGMQPNFHSLYADNVVLEGNTVVNFNSTTVQFITLWYRNHKYVTIPIGNAPTPPNLFVVYRRCVAVSEGGVWIGTGAQHVIVEDFAATDSATCVDVDADTKQVLVRNAQCT